MSNPVTTPHSWLYKYNNEYTWSLLFNTPCMFKWVYKSSWVARAREWQEWHFQSRSNLSFSLRWGGYRRSNCHYHLFQSATVEKKNIPATCWVPMVKCSIWGLSFVRYKNFVFFPWERINLVIQMISQAFLYHGKGIAWTQIRTRQAWKQLSQSSQPFLSVWFSSGLFYLVMLFLGILEYYNYYYYCRYLQATTRPPVPARVSYLLDGLVGVRPLSGPGVVTLFGLETVISLLALL